MDLQGLKTGLFGFKKKDVCEYISQMNDELGKRLSIEKEKDNATIAELKSKIESLSAENSGLKSEIETEKSALNDKLSEKDAIIASLENKIDELKNENIEAHRKNDEVAEIILDARSFANGLREKAIAENDEMCRMNDERNRKLQDRLSSYESEIEKIRWNIQRMLKNMDGQLGDTADDIMTLRDDLGKSEDEESDDHERKAI